MPLPPPTFAEGYALTTAHEVSRTVFNGILGDIKTRIAALQSVVVAYEAIEAAGIEASLAVITDSITPQLEALAAEMSAIQALIVVAEGQLLALQNAGVDAENITIGDDVGLGTGLNLEDALTALKAYADDVGEALNTAKVSVADKASQVEARAGTDNSKWMTPLRVREQRLLRANVQSSAYTAVAADFGLEISCSGTFTLSLTAAATLGDGWFVWVRNAGSGVITIDPNGAETIDGVATIAMGPGEAIRVSTDGSLFRTTGRRRHSEEPIGGVLTGAGVAALNWSGVAGYDLYKLIVLDWTPDAGGRGLNVRTSTDGGSTFQTWISNGIRHTGGNSPSGFTASDLQLTPFDTVVADNDFFAEVQLILPRTSGKSRGLVRAGHREAANARMSVVGSGMSSASGVVNYIRISQSSGNITSIRAQLYGIKTG